MNEQAKRLQELVSRERKLARTIAFTSGKGGVGKTNIAVNLACVLAQHNKKVLIIDADLSLANIDLLFGVTPEYDLRHVIFGERLLEDIIIKGPGNVNIVPAASGVEELADLTEEERVRVIDQLKQFERVMDFIFIDTAAGVSRNVTSFLLAADEVVVITTPELTALTDAYAIIKIVARYRTNPDIKVIVNMLKEEEDGDEIFNKIRVITHRFLNIDITNLGYIYEDKAVREAVQNQVPFVLSHPHSIASSCIRDIAKRLLRQEKQEQELGFFERLVKIREREEKLVNKRELINRLKRRPQIQRNRLVDKVEQVFDAFIDTIVNTMKHKETIELNGLGIFEGYERKEYVKTHPVTGEQIIVKSRIVPRFREWE